MQADPQASRGLNNGELSTVLIDHIVGNDTQQDAVAVCCISDAILARILNELLLLRSMCALSDNAPCYQNCLLPVIAPFICRNHNIQLDSLLHFETQCGRSLVDAHFELTMRHVNRYCAQTGNDFSTPSDLVSALSHRGGIVNCVVELLHIRRASYKLRVWVDAVTRKTLMTLGRVNEFKLDT